MNRSICSQKLKKITAVIEDVSLDVTILFPLVDEFVEKVTGELKSAVDNGVAAERLLTEIWKD